MDIYRKVTSRIEKMEYDNKTMKLYFVLKDHYSTLWFKCLDDDEAYNLSDRLGRKMAKGYPFIFIYNRNTLEVIGNIYPDESKCVIS